MAAEVTLATSLHDEMVNAGFALLLEEAAGDAHDHGQHGNQGQHGPVGQGRGAHRAAVADEAPPDHDPEVDELVPLRERGPRTQRPLVEQRPHVLANPAKDGRLFHHAAYGTLTEQGAKSNAGNASVEGGRARHSVRAVVPWGCPARTE